MKSPIRIAITGAAGQIAYSLIFKIANGDMLGEDQPIILQLLDIPGTEKALEGVAMEIEDSAYDLVHAVSISTDPKEAFWGANYAILLGSRPRGPGMERSELLSLNAAIFSSQGKALNEVAADDLRVLVVGNPANTNALIAARNAPRFSPAHFSALMRLDHNRAIGHLAEKMGVNPSEVFNVAVFGNHSAAQLPWINEAYILGEQASSLLDESWYLETYLPKVSKRGASVIEARGKSSAASCAKAIVDHMKDWTFGSSDVVSMAIVSDGSYGVPKGLMFGFPVICEQGAYRIIQDFELSSFAKKRLQKNIQELQDEYKAISHLLPKETEAHFLNLPLDAHDKTDYALSKARPKLRIKANRTAF